MKKIIEDIIAKYETKLHELQEGKDEFDKDTTLYHYLDGQIRGITFVIYDLKINIKNLPNELQDVNNNELTQEVCGLCNGDKWITTPHSGEPCPACGGTGLKQTER